jgi:hypothetical protein
VTNPTVETVLEELVQLVADMGANHIKEEIRQRSQYVLVLDYHRRNIRDGKHPIAGETQQQYEDHMNDPARGGRGYHPVTKETIEDYENGGKAVFASVKEAKPNPKQ